jgi:RNA polymerase sigma factor (sigma-70 family)
MDSGQDAADLGEFIRTGSQPAFGRLASRYAGMVYAACLCRLASPEDAEDASQAVFLALARKARSVGPEQIGSWLHGAAMRAATFVLRSRARRTRHEEEAARMRSASGESAAPEFGEMRPHLGAAVEELPGKLREVVTRHYFAGQSRAEIARELGLPEGTVASRVSAGLERLRHRLEKRGVCCGLAALGPFLAGLGGGGAPASLLASLPALASGSTAALAAAGAGGKVAAISEGVLRMMFWAKVKVAAIILACGLAPVAAVPVVVSLAGEGDKPAVERPAEPPVEAPAAKPADQPAEKPADAAVVTVKVKVIAIWADNSTVALRLASVDDLKKGESLTCKANGWTGTVTDVSQRGPQALAKTVKAGNPAIAVGDEVEAARAGSQPVAPGGKSSKVDQGEVF